MDPDRNVEWEQLRSEIIGCRRCPRLVEWRERVAREKRRAYRACTYWGRPVPGFGDRDARLVVIGLAPAAHGANRTGRMFTGDGSADTLLAALHRVGLASQPYSRHREDGLELHRTYLTAVVRCAPPGNRPNSQEVLNCSPYLKRELGLLKSVRVILTLGRVAFAGYLDLLRRRGVDVPRVIPRHGDFFDLGPELPILAFSYHPSRQNTQTGRLTEAMLDDVMGRVGRLLSEDHALSGVAGSRTASLWGAMTGGGTN